MSRAAVHPGFTIKGPTPAKHRAVGTGPAEGAGTDAVTGETAAAATAAATEGGASASATLAATDPRWVLALRVHESLEGALLRPETRARLIRLGRVLGLTGFEANLVIAIVQDGARRGQGIGEAAGSLASVPRHRAASRPGRWTRAVAWASLIIATEAVALIVLFG